MVPNELSPRSRRFKPILIALFAVLLFVGLAVFLVPPPPTVVISPLPHGWPSVKRNLSDRIMGAMPVWVWRLKDSLLGPAKRILLKSVILDCRGLSNSLPSVLLLGEAQFTDPNGRKVWIFGNGELDELHRRLEQMPGNAALSSPRMDTADGVEAQMFAGETVSIGGSNRQTGLTLDYCPHLHRRSTDLRVIITLCSPVKKPSRTKEEQAASEVLSIQTNLSLSARMQIPNGHGVFLLDAAQDVPTEKRIGILISAERH